MIILIGLTHANAAEQSQDKFAAAISDRSTAPYLIHLTVVDDRTGATETGCIPAPFLVGAIQIESNLGNQPALRAEAERIAVQNTTHVFHFSKQAALDNMPFNVGKYQEACMLVERGKAVRLGDRDGQIHADP